MGQILVAVVKNAVVVGSAYALVRSISCVQNCRRMRKVARGR